MGLIQRLSKKYDRPLWLVRLNFINLAPIALSPIVLFGSVFLADHPENTLKTVGLIILINSYSFILLYSAYLSLRYFPKSKLISVLLPTGLIACWMPFLIWFLFILWFALVHWSISLPEPHTKTGSGNPTGNQQANNQTGEADLNSPLGAGVHIPGVTWRTPEGILKLIPPYQSKEYYEIPLYIRERLYTMSGEPIKDRKVSKYFW